MTVQSATTFDQILTEILKEVNIHVDRVEYRKSTGHMDVFLSSDTLMVPDARDAVEKALQASNGLVRSVHTYCRWSGASSNAFEMLNQAWPTITWLTKKLCPTLNGILQQATQKIEGSTLTIGIPDHFSVATLQKKNVALDIQKQLANDFSATFTVRFDFDEHLAAEGQEAYEKGLEEKQKVALKEQLTIKEGQPRRGGGQKQESGGFGGNGGGKGKKSTKEKAPGVLYRNKCKRDPMQIKGNLEEEAIVCFEGKVFEKDMRDLKSGKKLISFSITDYTYSVACKVFAKPDEGEELYEKIEKGKWYIVEGTVRYDTFAKELMLFIMNINEGKVEKPIMDNAPQKRVELHCHTTMSDMDGVTSAKALVSRADQWGHPAIAITDHGVLQAFPEAMHASDGKDVKVIYGVEGYLFNDDAVIIKNPNDEDLDQTFVVFDIETTGLSFKHDRITEIGAVKVSKGGTIEEFSALVNPQKPIPQIVVELTGITDEMVKDKPTIDAVLPKFLDFIGDAPVVAHNAAFDVSFIKAAAERLGKPFNPVVVDTLALSRLLMKDMKRHKLNTIAKKLKIKLDNHHRAVDDAQATASIFHKFVEMLRDQDINDMHGINALGLEEMDYKNADTYHVIILVKNQKGLKELYKLVSHSNIKTFYRRPRIPKSMLNAVREDLIIGSACEAGELFKAIFSNKSEEEIEEIANFYDFLEIQPTGNNAFMIKKGIVSGHEELQEINKRVLDLGEKLGKTVAATGDVHFMDPQDEVYRRIIMAGKGFDDADDQAPLYFRTTEDMLSEFKYLGTDKAFEVVVENTNKIADLCEPVLPIPKETYPPRIEGSDDELRRTCFEKARNLYGDDLPQIVEERLETELQSIISNGYSVMYIIGQKLVVKSLEDGYLVGSRGSVGSSFAATMSDITEVNPLPPHYLCKECKTSEFILDGSVGSGADLPDKTCTHCGATFKKDGYDIPFATFLGFNGDKEPDIDLNFAGVYQATSHKYTEELFGTGYVYKAGTIGTVADKTAFGYVRKYFEERGIPASNTEVVRLSQGCTGIKRTSGQHPGGIMVIPDYKDVHDFCPIQYPANDTKSDVITTHFDYHSISGRILKLDILGHDVPTIIRLLEDITGVDIFDVPLDDRETAAIFTSVDTLKIQDPDYKLKIGSLGIPEFGTRFVRQMLVDTQPSTFADLVRISGLSHGTDVWLNNAQDLVRQGTVEIKDVISTRDDIMVYLMYQGLEPLMAFKIMEKVRKGKGLTEEDEALMKENNVPEWYIWSCNQIKYMFPKAHAVAYVMMSFRIAYFKVHHPLAFYATFFHIKVDDFDAQLICQGKNAIRARMRQMDGDDYQMSNKEEGLYIILELCDEMNSRGFDFLPIDLMESDATMFKIIDGKILPPFQALQGVGENAAHAIVAARAEGEFLSIEDLRKRAKVTKTVIEAMQDHGCLKGLPESNQLSLFSFA